MKKKIISNILAVSILLVFNSSIITAKPVNQENLDYLDEALGIFAFLDDQDTTEINVSKFLEEEEEENTLESLLKTLQDPDNEADEEAALTAGVTAVMDNSDTTLSEAFEKFDTANLEEGDNEEEEILEEIDCSFTEVEPYQMYVGDTFLRARSEPSTRTEDSIVGVMKPGKIVNVIGERDDGWYVIWWKDQNCFVASEFLDIKKPVSATYNWTWTGAKLNRSAGIINGPSGNETYYNLNMSRCVAVMQAKGYRGEAWVREDGVKMFGDYIMCAANLKLRPKGTIVESSLGDCIVVDTGGFASYDSTRLDIATTW